MVGFH